MHAPVPPHSLDGAGASRLLQPGGRVHCKWQWATHHKILEWLCSVEADAFTARHQMWPYVFRKRRWGVGILQSVPIGWTQIICYHGHEWAEPLFGAWSAGNKQGLI